MFLLILMIKSLTGSKAMDMNGCGPIRTARIGTSPAAGPPAALATPQISPGDHVVRVVRVLLLSSCASSSEAKTGCEGLHPVPGTENTAPVRYSKPRFTASLDEGGVASDAFLPMDADQK